MSVTKSVAKRQPKTIPSHTFEPTSNKNIFRFVDRAGDWTHYWIKSQKRFVPAVNYIIRAGYPKGERFYYYLLHADPAEAERKLSRAGEEGSRTHAALRDLIAGQRITLASRYYNELSERFEALNAEEWRNLESFVAWCAKYEPNLLFQEEAVWSAEHNFAGTVDFVGTIRVPEDDSHFAAELWGQRILILIDWKTSSAIWDEHELQAAAYRQAVLEFLPRRLPTKTYGGLWTAIVRLGTAHRQGFEMKVWTPEESEANFSLFASAYSIFVRKHGTELAWELKEIPSEFAVKIPPVRRPAKRRPKKLTVP